MIDSPKQVKIIVSAPIQEKADSCLKGPHHHGAFFHPHHDFNLPLIVLFICLTLIALAFIIKGLLLTWQEAKLKGEKAARDEDFEHKKLLEESYSKAASERERNIKNDEALRKSREFLIMLIEKMKVKKESVITTPQDIKKPAEKKETQESINEEFLKLLIEKLKDISF